MIAKFGTINISMFLVTLIYVILGFFGYWRFYDVEIFGSITLNLPQEDWEAQSTKVTMACAVFLTFGLAAAIPKIDLFISLIGAVASSTLALIAPSIMHTLVFWDTFDGMVGKIKIGRNLFLL